MVAKNLINNYIEEQTKEKYNINFSDKEYFI